MGKNNKFDETKKRVKKRRNNRQCDVKRGLSMEYVKETGLLVTKKKESSFTPINISVGGHLVAVIKISATTRPTAL